MSSTTIEIRTTSSEQSLEDMRRIEAEANRRRLGAAADAVAGQQARYAGLVRRIDQARSRLPDLDFGIPPMPSAPAHPDPASIEAYAGELVHWLGALESRAGAAIMAAEAAQRRRRLLAQTWRRIHDAAAEIDVRNRICQSLSAELHASAEIETASLPNPSVSLEEAQAALQRLEALLARSKALQLALENRRQARMTAASLAGEGVCATTAAERLGAWAERQAATTRDEARRALELALDDARLSFGELPPALQLQARIAIDEARGLEQNERIADLVGRQRERLDGIASAQRLLATPPPYADPDLSARWRDLVRRLQALACGHAEWSNSLALEHRQIHEDATRAVQRAYVKASFIEAGIKAGFQIALDDDLVVMDLEQFPDYRVEFRQLPGDDGYATVAELKAAPDANPLHDPHVMDAVCRRLQAMADPSDARVESAVEIIEHAERLPRAKRPARRHAQAFAALTPPAS